MCGGHNGSFLQALCSLMTWKRNINGTFLHLWGDRPKCQRADLEPFFFLYLFLFSLPLRTAGTISGEEVPIVSKTNIKEYRDSFSCEKFTFRSNPNITFYVYVSNFSWPIKIQVRVRHWARLATRSLYLRPERLCSLNNCAQMATVLQLKNKIKIKGIKVEQPSLSCRAWGDFKCT